MSKRTRARSAAIQALYQWELTGQRPHQIESALPSDSDLSRVDVEYFRAIISGVPQHREQLDELITPGLERPMDDLDPVERAVLRVAVWEFASRKDVPWRVVIDEAVSNAKRFGSDNGYQFVNSVLDAIGEKIYTTVLALDA